MTFYKPIDVSSIETPQTPTGLDDDWLIQAAK
jgi:hypothetical protein